ncbi:MAG TPA: site-specific DNA-methyltransferase [Fimbriimonadaceae bacterium]|jgi:site-specific DNA-methyltransferase (cytosine-N4-specific)
MHKGFFEDVISEEGFAVLKGKVQLIFTSPPFPLNNKKRYDNKQGQQYLEWLESFGSLFRELLTPNGSLVIEMGNAWEPGEPAMSTLSLESLLAIKKSGDFKLCQQFVVNNPARLPSPAQWVTIKRIRVTDSFTHVWWMSPTAFPKADNRNVLTEYSGAMRKLLERGAYNTGLRPSEHHVSETSFLKDHGGAIPRSAFTLNADQATDSKEMVLEDFDVQAYVEEACGTSSFSSFSNTASSDPYIKYCKENEIGLHPARMPSALPEFFVKFLTDPGDLVLDPFSGSNTTGAAAERLSRKWICFEPNQEYINGSKGRFKL